MFLNSLDWAGNNIRVGIETETGFDVEGGVEVGVVVVFPLPADGVELVVTTG
ncbi:MAG: hypothetical protein IPH52_20140 [Leptospiraceae bacterium]|nr:hypothetical protein [Leptospiraceae bacterium]